MRRALLAILLVACGGGDQAPPGRAAAPRCAMKIEGDADARFIVALKTELARKRACERAYRLHVKDVPFERAGGELRYRARVTVLKANGALQGEYPVSVVLPGGARQKDGEERLVDVAGRRAGELFTSNFR